MCGGICTMLIYAFVLIIGISQFSLVLSMEDYNLKESVIYYDNEKKPNINL